MRWMVIDGIDCTGKTTLCASLSEHYARCGLKAVIKDEFSSSFIGEGIRRIVDQRRFFSLDERWSTPIADLMVIMADAFCKYEIDLETQSDVVVTDRGVLSAIAYQIVRLHGLVPEAKEGDLDDTLIALVRSASRYARWPDCHFNLKISRELLERRAEERDGSPLGSAQADMLMEVQDRMLAIGPQFRTIDIDVDGKTIDDLTELVAAAMERRRPVQSHP